MAQGISWAARRRTIVISILIFIVVAIGASFFIGDILHSVPPCTNGAQNQTDINCRSAINAKQPVVQFVRAIPNGGGRTDIIAYVENPNTAAAVSDAPYTIDMYGQEGTVITTRSGFVTLPPHAVTPIFITGVEYGTNKITNAFLTFNTKKMHWVKRATAQQLLPFSNIQVTQGSAPHITATITNPSTTVYRNLKVIISVFDSSNNIIAVSQTVVPVLYGLSTAPLVFTWASSFTGIPVREDLFPILTLGQ